MASPQSRTQVNANGSAAEPMQTLVPTSLVPGQSITDIGGPTPHDYMPDDDSAKLDNKGTSKASAPGGGGGAAEGMPAKIGGEVIPGNANHDGTKKATSGPEDKISGDVVPGGNTGPGKKYDNDRNPPSNLGGPASTTRRTVGQKKTYEHTEIDDTASESLSELADAQNASDDFKAKAKVIFESALNQKLQLEVARLEEEFSSRFESEVTEIAEKVEQFLNYTSNQWLEENKLVVENGIRNELSESFMGGLRSLFEDHYVTLPDEKYDIFESMVAKLDDMEDKLNEQIEANVVLASQMSGFQRQAVLSDVSWDLSETAKDKLAGLAESVEFESEENYREKLNILKESFVEGAKAQQQAQAHNTQYLDESAEPLAPTILEGMDSSMAGYYAALTRTVKR